MDKFKEEADDLNIDIDDAKLESYIQRFDQLKNSPKIQEKDLRKYSLSKLIKLVTSSEGDDVEEKEDDTPDVVYNDNGIIIYNGSKENNCVIYGRGERWCITRGSFSNYRYNQSTGYATFYLAKNTNLPDDNKLSFVAIQVRDVSDENKRYVYSNRKNDGDSSPMSFNSLMSEVSWLREVPNIRNILKYIPLSSSEKTNQVYSRQGVSIREWMKLPFQTKKQYLVTRKDKNPLFTDVNKEEFVTKYLPEYPQLATFIAITPGIIDPILLLKHLDKFSNNDRKSITANLRKNIQLVELSKENISFPVKKLLVTLNKWEINPNERLYVTKDGEAIVKLTFGDDVAMSIYTAEDDYLNVKLNTRTSKYLTEYPKLDELPFKNLLKLASDEVISKEFINTILTKAEEDPNSAIIIKDTDTGKIILDSNSFTSFKLENGRISPIPFDNEEVQNVLSGEVDNTGFQTNAVNLLFSGRDIPNQIDKDAFYNIINNTPPNNRTREAQIAIVDPASDQIALIPTSPFQIDSTSTNGFNVGSNSRSWRDYSQNTYGSQFSEEIWRKYFDYLRSRNLSFTDTSIRDVLNSLRRNVKNFLKANPPMSDTSELRPVTIDDKSYLVNIQNPQNSFRLSSSTGRLLQINANRALVARATGGQQAAAAPAGRRGRPAAAGAGVAAAAPAAPAAGGEANADVATVIENAGLTTGFNTLPANIRTRISAGTVVPYTRRNASLDAIGRVNQFTGVINAGQSRFYIIRMPSGRVIGFATMQPDARHYIVTGNASYRVPRVSQLAASLQANNINESLKTLIRLHSVAMPEEAKQMKEILLNLKNKKK